MSLSVVINTKNAESTVLLTLESVKFADEIVIVDMHSTDQTVKLAKQHTDKIFSYKDVGYVEPARNYAIKKATGDWILIVDADEEVLPGLKKKITSIMNDSNSADCYYIPRQNIVFGAWIQKTGWWPDYQLRLFKKSHVEWSDQIHSIPITRGKVRELPAQKELSLLHHNYQTVEQFVDRLNRYTSKESVSRTYSPETITPEKLTKTFFQQYFQRFFAFRGVDEGSHGVGLAFLQSTYEVVAGMKVWQDHFDFSPQNTNYQQMSGTLRSIQKQFHYWVADWHVEHTKGLKRFYWRLRRFLSI